jgi:hypothetical protein
MATPIISDNISELGTGLKVRHPGRTNPFSMKKRKGLAHAFMMHKTPKAHRSPARRAKTR